MLDSGRARRPRPSRDPARPRCRLPQGRDARGRPVRRVDPYRRRSGRGARRGTRADRQVARLRHPGRLRRRAGPVPRRRSQPGRPRAARGGHQLPGHPPRDGARGTRPDRLLDRWHPADRHGPGRPGDHGSRPRALPGRVGGGRSADRGLRRPAGDAAHPVERDGRPDRRGGRGHRAARRRLRWASAPAADRAAPLRCRPNHGTHSSPIRAASARAGDGAAADRGRRSSPCPKPAARWST